MSSSLDIYCQKQLCLKAGSQLWLWWKRVACSDLNIVDGLCRVEPNASSHVFLVHGQACAKSEHHPTCSHTEEGTTPMGKLYAIDFEEIMAEDWRVRALAVLMRLHIMPFFQRQPGSQWS